MRFRALRRVIFVSCLCVALACGLWVGAGQAEGLPVVDEIPEIPEIEEPAEILSADGMLPEASVDPAFQEVLRIDGGTAQVDAALANDDDTEGSESGEGQLTLNAERLKLGVGEKFNLIPSVEGPSDAGALRFTYSSSDKAIASVNKSGRVKGKQEGRAVITVTASDGMCATCAVRVLKAPTSLQLNAESVTLGVDELTGQAMTFQMAAKLPEGTASHISWSASDPTVADVSEDGLIRAVGPGEAVVTGRTYNGKRAAATVQVRPAPQALTLSAGSLSMTPGQKIRLGVTLPEGTAGEIRYVSEDPEVAKVGAKTGKITPLAYGSTQIAAVCFNGVQALCRVEVLPPPDVLQLSEEAIELGVGETRTLEATPYRLDGQAAGGRITYKSRNKKCATVSAQGLILGRKVGKTTVTAAGPGGVEAHCEVRVRLAPASVGIQASRSVLTWDPETQSGESLQLAAILPEGSASSILWSSSDEGVLRVGEDGMATAVGEGTAVVTAETYNGKTAGIVLRVCEKGRRTTGVVAHRGGAGYWPENTLEAFRKAASTGANAIELDVQTTQDGVQVVHHDAKIPVKDKYFTIAKHTYAALKAHEESLCTLDEALQVISRSGLELYLELKETADPRACVSAVRKWGMEGRTVYISFHEKKLRGVRSAEPDARLGFIFKKAPSNLNAILRRLKVRTVGPYYKNLTAAQLNKWQAKGLRVAVWTVDDEEEIRRWLDLGADEIISNYPKLVTQILKQ